MFKKALKGEKSTFISLIETRVSGCKQANIRKLWAILTMLSRKGGYIILEMCDVLKLSLHVLQSAVTMQNRKCRCFPRGVVTVVRRSLSFSFSFAYGVPMQREKIGRSERPVVQASFKKHETSRRLRSGLFWGTLNLVAAVFTVSEM